MWVYLFCIVIYVSLSTWLDSEHDVETLIEKIETEDDTEGSAETANNAFAFAKVWSAHKDDLEEIPEEVVDTEQGDSWAQTLQKIAAEQSRVEASQEVGRGARRKAKAKVCIKSYLRLLPDVGTGR